MSKQGKYIVLEGAEGVGKTTQVLELVRRLQSAGLPVRMLREPDSQSDLTARAIRQLTQDPRYPMNTRTEVLLYNAARAQSLEVIRRSVEQGVYCVVDRNYLTTLAIQYYGRGDVPDYQTINNIIAFAVGDNEPDLTIILDAPVQALVDRAAERASGERFDNLSQEFLERVRAGYLWEAEQRRLPVVDASLSAAEVTDAIWQLVSASLADKPVTTQPVQQPVLPTAQSLAAQAVKTDTQPATDQLPRYVTKNDNGSYSTTAAGRDYLASAVTSVDGNVYAFTDKFSPMTIAAAMARLSRRGDDMRITLLDEFAGQLGRDEKLLQRVISAYGDDSVQQLASIHIVIENATKYMTNYLERGRLAAYLEQSTRYIYYDQKDASNRYRYYVPTDLDENVRAEYVRHMDAIFDLYSEVVRKLTQYIIDNSQTPAVERDAAWKGAVRAQACDAARLMLPAATTTTVGLYASGQAVEALIMRLLSDDMPEARSIGQQMLEQARKIMPVFLERADKPDRGGATIAYRSNTRAATSELANKLLSARHSQSDAAAVNLVSVWPRNETDIVADMLYESSEQSLQDIQAAAAEWDFQTKTTIMQTYFGERLNRRHRPGRALEKIHYSWDLMCDFGIFCDLQRHRMVDDMAWQKLTPRYGFDTPDLIDQAGLTDQFEEAFAISLKLYSLLQQAGDDQQAQYATLLGHKLRWKMTYNAREAFHLHELRTGPQGHPGYRKLVQQMHDKVAGVHPILADAMKFVNKGEDEALARLAAERYTQFKLRQLED